MCEFYDKKNVILNVLLYNFCVYKGTERRGRMSADQLVNVVGYAGKLLIESGAEIYRVEETMVRLSKSFQEVEDADSFVTLTGIMLSITVDHKTATKIIRVHSRGVDLHRIDRINHLSRSASAHPLTLEQLEKELQDIDHDQPYSLLVTTIFSALTAFGFAFFFDGRVLEALCSFIVGIFIKLITWLLERREVNNFFINAIGGASAALITLFLHSQWPDSDVDIIIISSIMLLVPGLAITNAIRDTVAGDYLSGIARATEAILVAVAIAVGIGFILSIFVMQGGA